MRFRFAFASLIASLALLCGCNEGSSGSTPAGTPTDPVPAPQELRKDLLYGYYGDWTGQVSETQDHVNLQFVMGWGTTASPMDNIVQRLEEARDAGITHIVLQASSVYLDNPEARMRWMFDQLRALGLLHNIDALYPVDEPDTAMGYDAAKIDAANALLRKVMADYPELKDTKLAVIYGPHSTWPGIESYDWIGFDDYEHGAAVLTGQYLDLVRHLKPGQRTILVPGGADPWCQDPAPFFNQAEADPLVVALVPFIWFDDWKEATKPGSGPKGIRSNACRQQYVAAGARIVHP